MTAKKKASEEKFEDLLQRLEHIVENLENEETDLESALAAFEEGVKLSGQLNDRLNRAEKKIEMLLKNSRGELEPSPFDQADDDNEPV